MKYQELARNPLIWIAIACLLGIVVDVFISLTVWPSSIVGLEASNAVVGYGLACWIWKDSNKRKIYFPADLTLLFSWIAIPAYAYESRGWKGILFLVLAAAGYIIYLYLYSTISY